MVDRADIRSLHLAQFELGIILDRKNGDAFDETFPVPRLSWVAQNLVSIGGPFCAFGVISCSGLDDGGEDDGGEIVLANFTHKYLVSEIDAARGEMRRSRGCCDW